MQRKKILFIVEALTLAHVFRSALLAKSLQSLNYEVHFACRAGKHRDKVANDLHGMTVWPLTHHVTYSDFVSRISKGHSPYSLDLLRAYVEEETALILRINPDIVIGDLRYALSISCHRTAKFYINLVNAIWSPFTQQQYVVPEGQLTRLLGPQLGALIFSLAQKRAFHNICQPFNQVRSEFGLPTFKDVFELHCAGDLNLYLDPPHIFNTDELPANHQFIGPVLASLPGPMPDPLRFSSRINGPLPIVFATLGSSGSMDCLPNILECLEQLPLRAVLATCGRRTMVSRKETTILRDFLPAREIIRKSSLVISNGGSPISYLAMSEGVPVIAVCSNMDQHLTAQALVNYGSAIAIRSENASQSALHKAIHTILSERSYRERAQQLSRLIAQENTLLKFQLAIERAVLDNDRTTLRQNIAQFMSVAQLTVWRQ